MIEQAKIRLILIGYLRHFRLSYWCRLYHLIYASAYGANHRPHQFSNYTMVIKERNTRYFLGLEDEEFSWSSLFKRIQFLGNFKLSVMDKWENLPIPEEVIQSIWWITLPTSGISQSRYQVMNVDTCPPLEENISRFIIFRDDKNW